MTSKEIVQEAMRRWSVALLKGTIAFVLFWLFSTFIFTNLSWFHEVVSTNSNRLFWSAICGVLAFMSRIEEDPHWGARIYMGVGVALAISSFVQLFASGFRWSDLGQPIFYLLVMLPMGMAGPERRSAPFSKVPPVG